MVSIFCMYMSLCKRNWLGKGGGGFWICCAWSGVRDKWSWWLQCLCQVAKVEIIPLPLYSALSDYFLFPNIKNMLRGIYFFWLDTWFRLGHSSLISTPGMWRDGRPAHQFPDRCLDSFILKFQNFLTNHCTWRDACPSDYQSSHILAENTKKSASSTCIQYSNCHHPDAALFQIYCSASLANNQLLLRSFIQILIY